MCSTTYFGYRGAQIGVENIVKKDPGKAKQKRQGIAGRNFTKPFFSGSVGALGFADVFIAHFGFLSAGLR